MEPMTMPVVFVPATGTAHMSPPYSLMQFLSSRAERYASVEDARWARWARAVMAREVFGC